MTEKLEVGWQRSLKWDDREAATSKPAQPEASYLSNCSSLKKAGSPEWDCYKADKVGMQWHSTQSKRQVTCTEKVSNLIMCSSHSSPAGEKPSNHSTLVWLLMKENIHNCPILVSCRVSSNSSKISRMFWGKTRPASSAEILVFVTMVTECLGETRPAWSADWLSCYRVLHYPTMTHFGLLVSYQHFQLQRLDHTLVILLR